MVPWASVRGEQANSCVDKLGNFGVILTRGWQPQVVGLPCPSCSCAGAPGRSVWLPLHWAGAPLWRVDPQVCEALFCSGSTATCKARQRRGSAPATCSSSVIEGQCFSPWLPCALNCWHLAGNVTAWPHGPLTAECLFKMGSWG